MIWNSEIECADREQMHKMQSKELAVMAKRMYDNVPFYREKFKEIGFEGIFEVEFLIDKNDNYYFLEIHI